MKILVTGSIAFDFIMHYPGRFEEQLSSGKMNGVFAVPFMHRAYGGCAGNIAYALKKLDNEVILAAAVGNDYDSYRKRFDMLGISNAHLLEVKEAFTAQAYILTDAENNQMTIFHPGAMDQAHEQDISEYSAASDWAIVSPNGKNAMLKHAEVLAASKTPFIFDPGQGIPLFDKDELVQMFSAASCAVFNHDEFSLFKEKTGIDEKTATTKIPALIITNGNKGSTIFTDGEKLNIAPVVLGKAVDPTGCGDAYRAALLHGLLQKWQWHDIGNFASIVAGIKALSNGGQNYELSLNVVLDKYRDIFGKEPTS